MSEKRREGICTGFKLCPDGGGVGLTRRTSELRGSRAVATRSNKLGWKRMEGSRSAAGATVAGLPSISSGAANWARNIFCPLLRRIETGNSGRRQADDSPRSSKLVGSKYVRGAVTSPSLNRKSQPLPLKVSSLESLFCDLPGTHGCRYYGQMIDI